MLLNFSWQRNILECKHVLADGCIQTQVWMWKVWQKADFFAGWVGCLATSPLFFSHETGTLRSTEGYTLAEVQRVGGVTADLTSKSRQRWSGTPQYLHQSLHQLHHSLHIIMSIFLDSHSMTAVLYKSMGSRLCTPIFGELFGRRSARKSNGWQVRKILNRITVRWGKLKSKSQVNPHELIWRIAFMLQCILQL